MKTSNKCILRLIFNRELVDDMTDALLSFSQCELSFMSMAVQAHSPMTANHSQTITEQVSGFKRQHLVEVTLLQTDANDLYQHIKAVLPQAEFEAQLVPLLSFT